MSRNASGMPPGYQLVEARTAAQFDAARSLIEEYAAHLRTLMGVDLCFQNLSAELGSLSAMYGAPSGCLLLASRGEEWLRCRAPRRVGAGGSRRRPGAPVGAERGGQGARTRLSPDGFGYPRGYDRGPDAVSFPRISRN